MEDANGGVSRSCGRLLFSFLSTTVFTLFHNSISRLGKKNETKKIGKEAEEKKERVQKW